VSSLFTYVSNTKVASHFALNLVTLVVLSKTRIRFFYGSLFPPQNEK